MLLTGRFERINHNKYRRFGKNIAYMLKSRLKKYAMLKTENISERKNKT